MSKSCTTANLEITEHQPIQKTIVQVEDYYVHYRRTVIITQESEKVHKFTVAPCPEPKFKPVSDAELFYNIFTCGKVDEEIICNTIVCKSSVQRLHIVHEYKQLCGEDLIVVLKKKLSGDFKDLVVALMTPPSEYLACELHHAIHGIGTDEKTLIEIICSAANEQIKYIKASYEKLYCKNLEDDVCGDTSGSFQKLLVLLLQGKRSENHQVCEEEVEKDVSDLIAAGICANDGACKEDVIFEILACRSYAHLCQVFKKFHQIAQCHVEKVIEKKFGGDVKSGLLAIIKIIKNRAGFFAERIKDAVAGWGTKDRQLIRVIVSRCETDLKEIKEEYQKCYEKCLEDDVSDDTSGWYRKTLLCLVQDDH